MLIRDGLGLLNLASVHGERLDDLPMLLSTLCFCLFMMITVGLGSLCCLYNSNGFLCR